MLGNKEEFLDSLNPIQLYLGELVWEWTVDRGNWCLKIALQEMKNGLGTDKWKEVLEDIKHCGPDNYQLSLPRGEQEYIKAVWWKLVKYQYNLEAL